MKKILLSIFICITVISPVYAHIHKEKYYQDKWCKENNGKQEVVLDDGVNSRVDCLTDEYAVEAGFSGKEFEDIGQSLYYALMTGKKPGILYIMENPAKETKYLKRLDKVARKYGITVWTISE